MTTEYNKLVRDDIPKIIEQDGGLPKTRILGDDEYKKELLKKLVEEAGELLEDSSTEERADVEEVLLAIDAIFGFTRESIEKIRLKKLSDRGGFDDRVFLESVEE